MRSRPFKTSGKEDPLLQSGRSTTSVKAESAADNEFSLAGITSGKTPPRSVLQMQGLIGNAAVQRILLRSAAPEAEHQQACACPMCKPQRVYTDEPLAPEAAHAPGCGCAACGGQQEAVPQAQAVQRWWGDEEEEASSTESEDSGSWVDEAVDTVSDWASGDSDSESGEAEGEESSWVDDAINTVSDMVSGDSDSESGEQESGEQESGESEQTEAEGEGELLSVREDYVPDDVGGKPDMGLHVAVVSGGEEEQEEVASQAAAQAPVLPTINFVDQGRVGTMPVDMTGGQADDQYPHAFTDGGMTSTVVWAGGGGAGPRGNQGTGTIQTYETPTYESRSNGITSDSNAWVKDGTGKIDVTRSWLGANAGDQGNGHFVTSSAAARFNSHEILHVNSTRSIYDTNIPPMLARLATYYASAGGTTSAFLQISAIWALKDAIGWEPAVKAFQDGDTAANAPMKTIDTNDLASGTYPVDRGPGKIGGKDYQHRVTLPSEAAPA